MTSKRKISENASKVFTRAVYALNFAVIIGLGVVGSKAISSQSQVEIPPTVAALCSELNGYMAANNLEADAAEDALRRHIRSRSGATGYVVHVNGTHIWLNPPSSSTGQPIDTFGATQAKSVNCSQTHG